MQALHRTITGGVSTTCINMIEGGMLCLCICSMANFCKDEKGGQHGEDVVIFSVRVL